MQLRPKQQFILLFLIVLVSRLPFLYAGYGVEEDSWGIALAAFHTKLTGIYEPSRFPGHPVQELIYSALWGAGPLVFNGLCALFSAIAAVYFAKILELLRFRFYFLASLALAFVPVFYISSTYTIDFVWSEAFVLMSFYYLLKRNFIPVGIFLGLAVGCRITCGVMLLPYMIILWQQNNFRQNVIRFFKIAIPMGVVVLLAFLPIILQFGTTFFMYYDQFPYPPLTKVLYKMTLGVFGAIGLWAIVWMVFTIFVKRKWKQPGSLFEGNINKRIVFCSFLLIGLYIISYFRLPQKSGYMLPVIPFVILLFGYYLDARNFKILCAAFLLSSFLCSINLTDKLRGAAYSPMAVTFRVSGQELFFDVLSGPVFSDYSKRKQKMNYTEEVIAKAATIQSKTVIIAGWWYNEIMVTEINRSQDNLLLNPLLPLSAHAFFTHNPNVRFEAYIDEATMNTCRESGYRIYYLPEQNIYNDQMYKMRITDGLAQPF